MFGPWFLTVTYFFTETLICLVTLYMPILTLPSKIHCRCHILHVANICAVNSVQEHDFGEPFSCKRGVYKMIPHVTTLLHSDQPCAEFAFRCLQSEHQRTIFFRSTKSNGALTFHLFGGYESKCAVLTPLK